MMWRCGWYFLCIAGLVACGTSKPYVDNTYEAQLKNFTHAGVKAMQESCWDRANHAFSRALQFSELLSDPALEVRSLYNLGMAYKGQRQWQQAQDTWLQAQRIARQYALTRAMDRIAIQLALLHPKQTKIVPTAKKNWSTDMYLSLGAWMQLRGDDDAAKQAYQQVLTIAADDKSGLLLQGRAMLGLAALPHGDDKKPQYWAEQALHCFRQVGAPKRTAQSLMRIAHDAQYPHWKRLDSARRAQKIYSILQHSKAAEQAQKLADKLQYDGDEHE